jgi:hypothetical protein
VDMGADYTKVEIERVNNEDVKAYLLEITR